MTRTVNRFFALSFAVVATLAVQGTMLAGFDNLAHAGQMESQARAAASACTAANAHLAAVNVSHTS